MIKIRTARCADIKGIQKLARDFQRVIRQKRGKFFGRVREFKGEARFYQSALGDKNSVIFVAEKEGFDIIGYAYATIEKTPDDLIAIPYVSLNEIVIAKNHRHGKVGTLLMKKIHRWAEKNGLKVIQLATWEFNKPAIKFFEKLGYETIMRKMEKIIRPV